MAEPRLEVRAADEGDLGRVRELDSLVQTNRDRSTRLARAQAEGRLILAEREGHVGHRGGPDSRMAFLTAIDEQLRRDPLGATWTGGGLQRPTRGLVPISTGVSWPIVTPGCLSDADAIAALDDRGLSMLPEFQRDVR